VKLGTKKILAIVFAIALVALMSSSAIVAASEPISTDPKVILKYYDDGDPSKNNVVLGHLDPNWTSVSNGFSLEVKKTAFDGLPANYKECFYDLYLVPGDARPASAGGTGNDYNFDGANFYEIFGVEPYISIKPSSSENGSRRWNTVYPSDTRTVNPIVLGNPDGYAKPGCAIDIDIDLETCPTSGYSASQRYYTLAIVVWGADGSGNRITPSLGYSDLYTVQLAPDGSSDPIALVGNIKVTTIVEPKPNNFTIIAIIGASVLVLAVIAIGTRLVLKRKKRLKNS